MVERMSYPESNSAPTYDVKSLDGFECIQPFDRYKMGLLWNNKRDDLDPGQRKLLKALWDNKQRGTLKCKTPIIYKLNGKAGELGYGRYYGTRGSLEQLERDVRATLCSETYWDIDIVNCHPVLAVQLAKREFNQSMPMLDHYVQNRKECLAKFMTYGLSESDAKQVVISLINGGALKDEGEATYSEELRNDSIVSSIKSEVKQLINNLITCGKHNELYNHLIKQKGNYRGSFIANIYQTEERKCLDVIVAVLKTKGYKVAVLSYDGCMILKENTTMPQRDTLKEIEDAIRSHTGYSVELKIKPMEDEVIPLGELQQASEDGYKELKVEWERNHFYFQPTGTIVEAKDNGKLVHFKIDHATEAFNMWRLKTKDNNGEFLPFLRKWRNDPERRIVEELVYKLPEDCKPNEATLFGGFAYKKIEEELTPEERDKYIEIYRGLISNIASEDSEVFDALLKNFARVIQKPFERPDICIILRSTIHGVGKESLVNVIKSLIGKNIAHYISDDSFWDKHDAMKEGALVVHLEEAGLSNKKMADALKARITSNVCTMRPCGVSSYNVPNVALYIFTTNKECPVKIEESDRRYFIINAKGREWSSPDEMAAYWDYIYSIIYTPKFLRAIGEYLETIDLTGFIPRRFPITEYKEAIMDVSETPEVQFLKQWEPVNSEKGDYIDVMYNSYKEFCMGASLPYKQSSISFAVAIASRAQYYDKKRDGRESGCKGRALYKKKAS